MGTRRRTNEIQLTRLYDAPLKLVWEAWTDPERVAVWWGPRGFTLTTHEKALRPGGIWHYTMHGPDGVDYPNKTRYLEVDPCKRLVYDHGGYDDREPLFRVTVLFSEHGGKTKMDMTMALKSVEAAEEARTFIKRAGGNTTWDRLAEYLTKEASGEEVFVLHRTFEAPREVVFRMWTDPKHVARWLPPSGFTMQYLRADIRTGSSSLFRMTNGSDVTFCARAEYLAVEPSRRVEYMQQFCDENERAGRHPLAPVWPERIRVTVTFDDEPDDSTRVTLVCAAAGAATREELEAFAQERAGMTRGWTGSFDTLEALLAQTDG